MSYEFYKVIHIIGVVMAITALGALALQAAAGGSGARKPAIIGHGVGLVLALVAGFGLMAKAGLAFGDNLWIVAKIAIWLLVGGLVAVVKRKPNVAVAVWWSLPGLVGVAAWLAIARPF